MTNLFDISNGKMTVNLHPGQTKAWDSKARFTFVVAGTQGGKTSFEPLWLDREIKNCGEGDYLAVTATYDLFKLKFLPVMKQYFCDIFKWQYAASEKVIWKNEGNDKYRIILRSANAEGGLESATAKAAVLDECGQDDFGIGAWEAIQRRLSLSQGRVFGGTTPYNLGWLKTEVFDRWQRGDKDYQVIQFRSTMNPLFPIEEYERAKATMPTWKFEMFYNGNFSRPAGMIYSDLTDNHYVKPFAIPPSWPRYIGIDPGPNNTAVVWMAKNPETKCYYLYREYLEGDKTTKEHADAIKLLSYNENIFHWALGQKSEKQYRLDWQEQGLPVNEPNITDVDAGIDRVIALIKQKTFYIFDNLKGCKDQFGTYSRKLDDNGQPTTDIKDKEKYHFLDAVRYCVIGFDDTWSVL